MQLPASQFSSKLVTAEPFLEPRESWREGSVPAVQRDGPPACCSQPAFRPDPAQCLPDDAKSRQRIPTKPSLMAMPGMTLPQSPRSPRAAVHVGNTLPLPPFLFVKQKLEARRGMRVLEVARRRGGAGPERRAEATRRWCPLPAARRPPRPWPGKLSNVATRMSLHQGACCPVTPSVILELGRDALRGHSSADHK